MLKNACALSFALLVLVCSINAAAIGKHENLEYKRYELLESRAIHDEAYNSSEDSDEDNEDIDEELAQQHALALTQAQERSEEEESDEDGGDDDDDVSARRHRRDVDVVGDKQPTEETAAEPIVPEQHENEADKVDKVEAVTEVTATVGGAAAGPTRKPNAVLVMIRDALKKVTTGLPTEQVATNALQYFQLFEHFIQQTIEEYITDDDEEDEAEPAAATTVIPETSGAEFAETAAEVIKAPESLSEKQTDAENAIKPESASNEIKAEAA